MKTEGSKGLMLHYTPDALVHPGSQYLFEFSGQPSAFLLTCNARQFQHALCVHYLQAQSKMHLNLMADTAFLPLLPTQTDHQLTPFLLQWCSVFHCCILEGTPFIRMDGVGWEIPIFHHVTHLFRAPRLTLSSCFHDFLFSELCLYTH